MVNYHTWENDAVNLKFIWFGEDNEIFIEDDGCETESIKVQCSGVPTQEEVEDAIISYVDNL